MLAGGEKSRIDSRTTAMLAGRMRDASGLREVRIGDLSPQGLLVVSSRPPARGDIVDIMINGHHFAGQVRWVNGRRFGLRTRERIDVRGILSGKPPKVRQAGKRIEESNDPKDWAFQKLLVAYGLLGATAFATAYLIWIYFIQ